MAEATLNDVTAILQEQNEEQGKTTAAVAALVQRIQGLIDIQKRSILDEAEARREAGRDGGVEPPSATGGFGTTANAAKGLLGSLGVLELLGVKALIFQAIDTVADIVETVSQISSLLAGGLLKALQGAFVAIDTSLELAKNALLKDFSMFRYRIAQLISRIQIFFQDTGKRIGNLANRLLKIGKPIITSLSNFGKLLGRLFLPVFIVITAIETAIATVKGYQEDGIIGALEGAVTGLFNSLIFGPLDLVKGIAAWVLGKFGFENAKDILNSFSFQDIFSNLIGGIFDDVGKIGSFVGDLFKGEFSLEKAQEALGAIFSLSPVGMIMNLVEGIVPGIFEKIGNALDFLVEGIVPGIFEEIGNALDFFVEQLKIGSQEALLKVMNLIQNIPDQLVAFLSDNLRISIPKIAIPIPGFLGGGELVIAEPSEIGVPGGESARAKIAERNARLEAQLLELNRQNLQNVQGVAAGGTTVINQNSTISNAQSTTIASDIPAAQDIYMNKGLLGGGGGF